MPTQFVQPSQSAYLLNEKRQVVGHVSLTGPVLFMPTPTKTIPFEMHSYHGPIPLRRDGQQSRRVPREFWPAFEAWQASGMLVENYECVLKTEHESLYTRPQIV